MSLAPARVTRLQSVRAMVAPRVFISYSPDSEPHCAAVLQLAQHLRQEGLDVRLDRFVMAPPEGWPRWKIAQVADADFVLLVCTDAYRRHLEGGTADDAKGAAFESLLTLQHLHDANGRNEKLIPVVFAGATRSAVPLALHAYTRYTLPGQLEALYRHITGQPEVVPAPLGPLRVLPPRVAAETGGDGPLPYFLGGTPDAAPRQREDPRPWRRLSTAPSFLRPAERSSHGGLRLLDVQAPTNDDSLPVLMFTLKNETSGRLTLTTIVLDATCDHARAVFSRARPLEPVAFWDLEIPAAGGRQTFQTDPPLELPPDAATRVELRLHVRIPDRKRVPPAHCGKYTLRFQFVAGEGASASSEPIPC